jgi:predicted DNA-binding antitoxin AbrB/MazE fold protein
MIQRIEATFENGVFRPQVPVGFANGEQVWLDVEPKKAAQDDLDDIRDLLDAECVDACRQQASPAPSLEEVRRILSGVDDSLAERLIQERNER